MKNILVITEFQNEFTDRSYELVSGAKNLKNQLDAKLVILALGHDKSESETLFNYGADEVFYNFEVFKNYDLNLYESAILQFIDEHSIDVVMFSNDENHKELAAKLSASLYSGLIADISGFEVSDGFIKWIRPGFSGKIFCDIRIKSDIELVTCEAGFSNIFKEGVQGSAKKFLFKFNGKLNSCEAQEILSSDNKSEPLKSDIVVGVGMGIGSSDNLKIIREFAEDIGAEIGATKSVCDIGWIERDRQIGITGNIISPRVYIALGISGAIQHVDGIKDTELFIAVDSDPDAQIFKVANYYINADLFEVLPILREKIKARI